MEKESIQTVLSYKHQREVRKPGFRKGHGSRASRKVISMRNSPEEQRWEKAEPILRGQGGRSPERSCARRVCGSSQTLEGRGAGGCFWDKVLQCSHQPQSPVPAVHPATSGHRSNSARLWGEGRSAAGCAEKVSIAGSAMVCSQTTQPLLLCCGFPAAGCLVHPPSCPAFPGIIQRWGKKLNGRH